MTAHTRLSLALLAAAMVVAGVLAWLQWPLGGPDPDDMQARMERIERLRTSVERELQALERARQRREATQKELRELRESLEESRREIERLERELEEARSSSGTGTANERE